MSGSGGLDGCHECANLPATSFVCACSCRRTGVHPGSSPGQASPEHAPSRERHTRWDHDRHCPQWRSARSAVSSWRRRSWRETAALIAIQNLQLDLHAGFTAARDLTSHGNGYADVDMREAINQGRIAGPRFQVSGRGIIWAGTAPATAATALTAQRVQSVEEAIAAA